MEYDRNYIYVYMIRRIKVKEEVVVKKKKKLEVMDENI